jgi:YVTN family beta-propeller protein
VSQVNGRKAAHDDRDQIAVRNGPISDIAVSPDGSRLLVTNYGADSVSVIDVHARRVTETVDGLQEPFAIAMDGHDANRAYVSTVSPSYDAITVIDVAADTAADTVVATHPLTLSVTDLVASPDGKYVYASRNGGEGADLAVVDTATGSVQTVELATAPGTTTECVRVDPDGTRVYVATNGQSGGRLVVIDAERARPAGHSRWRRKTRTRSEGNGGPRVIDTVELGLPIRDVALSPDGAVAYIASCSPEFGSVVDVVDTRTRKITATRKITEITGLLTRITMSHDGDRAYLVSDDGVTVVCTRTFDVVSIVTVANQPSCVAESPDAEHLYIADYSGAVTVAPGAVTAGSTAHAGAPAIEEYAPALV